VIANYDLVIEAYVNKRDALVNAHAELSELHDNIGNMENESASVREQLTLVVANRKGCGCHEPRADARGKTMGFGGRCDGQCGCAKSKVQCNDRCLCGPSCSRPGQKTSARAEVLATTRSSGLARARAGAGAGLVSSMKRASIGESSSSSSSSSSKKKKIQIQEPSESDESSSSDESEQDSE